MKRCTVSGSRNRRRKRYTVPYGLPGICQYRYRNGTVVGPLLVMFDVYVILWYNLTVSGPANEDIVKFLGKRRAVEVDRPWPTYMLRKIGDGLCAGCNRPLDDHRNIERC